MRENVIFAAVAVWVHLTIMKQLPALGSFGTPLLSTPK